MLMPKGPGSRLTSPLHHPAMTPFTSLITPAQLFVGQTELLRPTQPHLDQSSQPLLLQQKPFTPHRIRIFLIHFPIRLTYS